MPCAIREITHAKVQVAEVAKQWQDLEKATEEKGQKLFDANRQQLYVQSISDMQAS